MVKRFWFLFILGMFVLLAACGTGETEEESEEENEESLQAEQEKGEPEETEEEQFVEMTEDEVQEILYTTTEDLWEQMLHLKEDNMEWYELFGYGAEVSEDSEEVQKAVNEAKVHLKGIMTEDYLEGNTAGYLEIFYCDCDAYHVMSATDTKVGLEIVEQGEDYFQAKTYSLANEMQPAHAWTNVWHFEKIDDHWKLAQYETIDSEEKPLDLSFEHIQESYQDLESAIELVDEIEVDGEKYFIIAADGNYVNAYNARTGHINYEITEEYAVEMDEAEEQAVTDQNEEKEHKPELDELNNPSFIHKYKEFELDHGLGKTEIKIPQFGLEKLDQYLYDNYIASREDELQDMEDANPTEDRAFEDVRESLFSEVFQDGQVVNVLMSEYYYEGGVSAEFFIESINYDLDKNEPIAIDEVLAEKGTSLERLDELIKSKLANGEVDASLFDDYEDGLNPEVETYRDFYTTKEELVVIINIYQIGPKSNGVITIPVGWDEF